MAWQHLNRQTLSAFEGRIEALRPGQPPRWGRMTPTQMLAHLHRTLLVSLGEVEVPDRSNWLTRTIGRWLVFHVLPWPKGRAKSPPEYVAEPAGDFVFERDRLVEAMHRFVEAAETEPERRERSPLLGPMTLRYWRRVHGIHFDHHLRQFGV